MSRISIQRTLTRPQGVGLLCLAAVCLWGLIAWKNAQVGPAQQHVQSGLQLLQKGDAAGAEIEWRNAVRLAPNNAEAWEDLGDLYRSSQQWERAYDAYTHVLQLDAASPELNARMADVALQAGNFGAAQKAAQKELDQNPNNMLALEVMAEVEGHNNQRQAQFAHLQQMVALEPNNPRALTLLAQELARRHEFDKALPVTEKLVETDPDSPQYHFMRGVALFTAGEENDSIKRAEADFQRALQLDPSNVAARRYLGRIFLRQNQPLKAIEQFETIGRGRPFASAHLLELSNAYRLAGNEKQAAVLRSRFARLKQLNSRSLSFKDRIRRDPDNPVNYLALGSLLLDAIESEEATFQLVRFRFSSHELQSVQWYFNNAARLHPQSAQDALMRLRNSYNSLVQDTQRSLRGRDYARANASLSRAVLLRPNARQTLALARPLREVGFDPYPPPPDPQANGASN